MLFGLKKALATFQRLMNLVFVGMKSITMFIYLDDIVIFVKNLGDHKVKIQPDEGEFLKSKVNYLGHAIGKEGVKSDPAKIRAAEHFPVP